MADFFVDLIEPARSVVTSDRTDYSADNTIWPTADGGLLEAQDTLNADRNVIEVEIFEPVGAYFTVDTSNYTADNASDWPTADTSSYPSAADTLDAAVGANVLFGDLVETASADDVLDAEVISEELPVLGGGYVPPRRRLLPVIGYGFGILPQLEGEAHGVVTVAGAAAGKLPRLGGSAAGSAGVAGRSAAQLVLLSAAAIGDCGQAGHGAGTILKFHAAAAGRHDDDDEAAVMAFFLAA